MSVRLLILVILFSAPLVGGVITLWAWHQAHAFLLWHPSIANEDDLNDLKQLIKRDMYLAFCTVVTAGLLALLTVFAIYQGIVGWSDLRPFIFIGPAIAALGILVNQKENRVRRLPVENESLRPEFDRVVKRWTSSPLPDW